MTGGEIAAISKVAEGAGKTLGEDQKTKEVLLRVAENTVEMKAAARSVAARTAVAERIKLKVIEPIGRLFGVGNEYFADTFPEEMAARLSDIPEENVMPPSPNIAGPAILGLSYNHGELPLKDLYLNLLATASDNRRANQAHPAFAEIIKQLDPDEAGALILVLDGWDHVPSARVRNIIDEPSRTYTVLLPHLVNSFGPQGEMVEESRLPLWIENWQRLGLVEATYMERGAGENDYSWVEDRPEYIRLAARSDIVKLGFIKGIITPTTLGRSFFAAVR